jgi:hypothetical protein
MHDATSQHLAWNFLDYHGVLVGAAGLTGWLKAQAQTQGTAVHPLTTQAQLDRWETELASQGAQEGAAYA